MTDIESKAAEPKTALQLKKEIDELTDDVTETQLELDRHQTTRNAVAMTLFVAAITTTASCVPQFFSPTAANRTAADYSLSAAALLLAFASYAFETSSKTMKDTITRKKAKAQALRKAKNSLRELESTTDQEAK